MKKIIIATSAILLIFATIRLLFFYTLFDIPYIFGTRTYVGGSKYDFPICITNPLKTDKVKEHIIQYLEDETREILQVEEAVIFFKQSGDVSDFDIISVNTDHPYENSFLLQSKSNSSKRCVVFINKKSNEVLRFGF